MSNLSFKRDALRAPLNLTLGNTMKMFVCPDCGYALETLRYPNSMNRGGKQLCGSCGASLQEKEVSTGDMEKLKMNHSKWTWRTFFNLFSVEVVFWLFLLLLFSGSSVCNH
jgi:predicted RNA-binding Zn-ribbon protein involved in translation (DUF1610 family)